jgi:hypothetical protein
MVSRILTGEFSISEFLFFSILFGATFNTIYPKIDTLVSSQEISSGANCFLIDFNLLGSIMVSF